MKRGLCSIVAALALAGASDALAGNGGDAVDPPALVRTLQFLQDDIAHGEVESDDARRKLIDLLGQRLLSAAPQTWRSSRNVEAALLYVLNGGNPAVLSRLPTNRDDALPAAAR